MSSLPVPVSPWISTVLFIGDTSSSVENSACIVLCAPDDVLEPEPVSELRLQFGVLFPQPLLLEAGLQHARASCDSWNGLIRKSTAPRLIAATASSTPPKPVMTTARICG